LAFFCALTLFSLNLDRPPHPDELHHALAAQDLFETGKPTIGGGEYWRGIVYTWLVALSYELFGEGLPSARIPAVLIAAMIAPLLLFWVRREASLLAAWITTALFISSPFTIEIAQFSRFYSLQILLFALGAICAFYSMSNAVASWWRVALGVLAATLLGLSVSQQDTSILGIAGVMIWIAGALAIQVYFRPVTHQATRIWRIVVPLFAVVLLALAIAQVDDLRFLLHRYRYAPPFAAASASDSWFYHVRFLLYYPTLWPLVGIATVLAVRRSARLGWFAITVFSISFLLASFAAQKATRYLSFAQPFLAMIWGIGLAVVVPLFWRHLSAVRGELAQTLALPQRLGSLVAKSLVFLAVATLFLTNPFWLRSAAMIGNVALPLETPTTNWRVAHEALRPWISGAEIVITTEELGALYFLGRADVNFNPSKFSEIVELAPEKAYEFATDSRTAIPTISRAESLQKLVECFDSGLVVGPHANWGDPIRFDRDAQAVIVKYAKPIVVPERSHLFAWGWKHASRKWKPTYCSDLARFSALWRRNLDSQP